MGICYSDENKVPTYNDFKKELGSTMQDYSFTIMDSFLALLIIAVLMSNSLMRSIIVPSIPFHNGRETNVGASTHLDDGDYFA